MSDTSAETVSPETSTPEITDVVNEAHTPEPGEPVLAPVPEYDLETVTDDGAPEAPIEADEVLLAASGIARSALEEITASETIGQSAGHEVHERHVLTLFFESLLPGYPGWRWAATLARTDENSPVNVLEVEMLPGETAVVAPEWVPWSERLAAYREAQARHASEEAFAAEAAAAELSDEDDVDPEDDLLENDFSDFDDEIDGVDIEESDDDDDDDDDDHDDDDDLEVSSNTDQSGDPHHRHDSAFDTEVLDEEE